MLIGGMDNLVKAGDRVVLKVNTNSGDAYPYSTSPLLVSELTRRLRARGAQVTVGDRSFWGDDDTAGNFERNGIAAAARSAGAELVVFDDSIAWVTLPSALSSHWRGPVRVPRMCVEADCLINLACLKTHFITGCTLALKNWLGLVHPADRARPGNLRSHHPERIYHQIADIHRFVRPHLNIVDAHRALVTGGPTPSSAQPTLVAPRVVIASHDRIAADATAIGLLKMLAPASEAVTQSSTWSNPTLVAAAGLGIAGPSQLDLRADGLTDSAELRRLASQI